MLAPVKPSRVFRRLKFREQGGVRSESHGGLVHKGRGLWPAAVRDFRVSLRPDGAYRAEWFGTLPGGRQSVTLRGAKAEGILANAREKRRSLRKEASTRPLAPVMNRLIHNPGVIRQ